MENQFSEGGILLTISNENEKYHIMVRVLNFLEENPDDGEERLNMLLDDWGFLVDVKTLMKRTGWSASHIYRLCEARKIPHIPGNPMKFVWDDVAKAIKKMQCGGEFRTRKRAKKY